MADGTRQESETNYTKQNSLEMHISHECLCTRRINSSVWAHLLAPTYQFIKLRGDPLECEEAASPIS